MINRIILLFTLVMTASVVNGQAGTLDPTFADNAELKLLNFTPDGEELLTHSITDSQDRTWIAGHTFQNGDWSLLLVRLDADGNYDTDFGGTGHAVLNLAADNSEEIHGLALQGDELIIAGRMQEDGILSPFILKYTSEGALDTDFGNNGVSQPPVQMNVSDVKVDNDGNIFFSGALINDNVVVVKLLPDGEVDDSFGFFGATTLDLPSTDQSVGLDFDVDGNIFVYGYGTLNGTIRGHVSAFTSTGAINTDFTANGRKSITWPDNKDFLIHYGFYEEESDHFFLVGRTAEEDNGPMNSAAVKLNLDAEQDMTFAQDGWLEIDLGIGADDYVNHIVKGPGGYYLTANVAELPQGINSAVIHIDESGERVETFGNMGIATYNIAPQASDQALSLSVQSDGKLILAGIAQAQEVGIYGYAARIITSNPLSFGEGNQLEEMSIYPNPARDYIQVSGSDLSQNNQNYRIFNLQGQVVLEGNINSYQIRISVDQLPEGTYILQMDGFQATKWVKIN